MVITNINQSIKLSKELMNQCEHYSESIDVYHYAKRDGQMDEATCRWQQMMGKMAECAVSLYQPTLGQPDFTIYSAVHKSWADDLLANNTVKACAAQAVPSWVFSTFDSSPNQTCVWFCQVDIDNATVKIDYTATKQDLNDNDMFQPMKKEFKYKRAVYSYDLKMEAK